MITIGWYDMGEKTGIAWTDHTFNPWIGCTKVSAGCLNCYAERQNNFYRWVDEWGVVYKRTSESNWKKPIQWAKNAVAGGVVRRVFCASLADIFDTNVTDQWRSDLWNLIHTTQKIGGLEWLILTKRPQNIITRIPTDLLYSDSSVRIGVTAENQEMYDLRLRQLSNISDGKNFVSVEPMIGSIELGTYFNYTDWIICGSESGANSRECKEEWVRSLRDQCTDSAIPFFLKQLPINGVLTVTPYLDGKQWLEFPEAI